MALCWPRTRIQGPAISAYDWFAVSLASVSLRLSQALSRNVPQTQPWDSPAETNSLLDWVGRRVQSARLVAGQGRRKQLLPLAALEAGFFFALSIPSFSIC
jgi:hypothetical protein